MIGLKRILLTSFNRINSGRSIPTQHGKAILCVKKQVSIVSIQADQSRRACIDNPDVVRLGVVSIVSIQADQSRHFRVYFELLTSALFQSYQFRQINPDLVKRRRHYNGFVEVSIVSIQADQSRP